MLPFFLTSKYPHNAFNIASDWAKEAIPVDTATKEPYIKDDQSFAIASFSDGVHSETEFSFDHNDIPKLCQSDHSIIQGWSRKSSCNGMQSCYREILPAPTARRPKHIRWSEDNPQEMPRNGRQKSKPIKIACQMCKRRKIKCDGKRPACTACGTRKDICRYDFDALENTTRYQALQTKYGELEQRFEQNLNLLELLRQRPYHEVLSILEHIRKNIPVTDILNLVAAGEVLLKVATTGRTANVGSVTPGAKAAANEDAEDLLVSYAIPAQPITIHASVKEHVPVEHDAQFKSQDLKRDYQQHAVINLGCRGKEYTEHHQATIRQQRQHKTKHA